MYRFQGKAPQNAAVAGEAGEEPVAEQQQQQQQPMATATSDAAPETAYGDAYDPTYEAPVGDTPPEKGQQQEQEQPQLAAEPSNFFAGYTARGARGRFHFERGTEMISKYRSPPLNSDAQDVFVHLRQFLSDYKATPPKAWREIRFELPGTVAELQLAPPAPEPVQTRRPYRPSPCVVLNLKGAMPEGMTQPEYMAQMVQYMLDLMKYNHAASAMTTVQFIKEGSELSQMVVKFGMDEQLADKMLDSLLAAHMHASLGQPVEEHKPNATFLVTDYKLTINKGNGISSEQVFDLLFPMRESKTVDICVIDGYQRGVFYVPMKRPEAVYTVLWNPTISFMVQYELFTRFGVLVTMADCPHSFLQKGVSYRVQQQQLEVERAKRLLLQQQGGARLDADGNVLGLTGAVDGAGGATAVGVHNDDDVEEDLYSDDDSEDGGTGGADASGTAPSWTALAKSVSIFNDDDIRALTGRVGGDGEGQKGTTTSSSAEGGDGPMFVEDDDDAPNQRAHHALAATGGGAHDRPAPPYYSAREPPPGYPGDARSGAPPYAGAAPAYGEHLPPRDGPHAPPQGEAPPGGHRFLQPPTAQPFVQQPPPPAMDVPELVSDDDDEDYGGDSGRAGAGRGRGGRQHRGGREAFAGEQRLPREGGAAGLEGVGDSAAERPTSAAPEEALPYPSTFVSWNLAAGPSASSGGAGQRDMQQPARTHGMPPPQQQQHQQYGGVDRRGGGDPRRGADDVGMGDYYGYDEQQPRQYQQQPPQQHQQFLQPPPRQQYGQHHYPQLQQQQQQQQQPALPMSAEDADNLVHRIQDGVHNAFPSLRVVDPSDANAMTEAFHDLGFAATSVPELVSPQMARVPIPTTEIDELTDLLEAQFDRIKALLECYEPPLQAARARLATTLMVSLPQREQARDWVPYVEVDSSDDDSGEDNDNDNGGGSGKVRSLPAPVEATASGAQLPALLPYILSSHEGTELSAMLATFYPHEFNGLFARYCLPFLIDSDIVQWTCTSALRADPTPYNALFSRVLQHWVPLTTWLDAYITLQAASEARASEAVKRSSGDDAAAAEKTETATALKRFVSQLGNAMDALLGSLSFPQRLAAGNLSRSSAAVGAFARGLDGAAQQRLDLWGIDGAARRTMLRLYLSADIVDGVALADSLFCDATRGGAVHSVSPDSYYFVLVALASSTVSPTLSVQAAALCGRYLQLMEVAAAAAATAPASKDTRGNAEGTLGEAEALQLLDTAFQHLAYMDAYQALRQAYLVHHSNNNGNSRQQQQHQRFPAVQRKLAGEMPPFKVEARPVEYGGGIAAFPGMGGGMPPMMAAGGAFGGYSGMGGMAPQGLSPAAFYGGSPGAFYGGYGNMMGTNPYPYQGTGGGDDGGGEGLLGSGSAAGDAAGAVAAGGDAFARQWNPTWTAAMCAYPLTGEPFTPLPTGWVSAISRSFGQYYYKPAGGRGSPTYTHPSDKTNFYVTPQAFIHAEADPAAVLRDVVALANQHVQRQREQQPGLTPPPAEVTEEEAGKWLKDQRTRQPYLDLATMEKLSITYRAMGQGAGGRGGGQGRDARKRSRSPQQESRNMRELSTRLGKLKNYPAKGEPFPELSRGWTANISSSTGLYVFRPPTGRSRRRGGGGGRGKDAVDDVQERHPGTNRRYRVSPQELVRHRDVTNEDVAAEAGVDVAAVQEWMADQRNRSEALDKAVVRMTKANYIFIEELDGDKARKPQQQQQQASSSSRGDGRRRERSYSDDEDDYSDDDNDGGRRRGHRRRGGRRRR